MYKAVAALCGSRAFTIGNFPYLQFKRDRKDRKNAPKKARLSYNKDRKNAPEWRVFRIIKIEKAAGKGAFFV